MLSYYVIYYKKFRKVIHRMEKEGLKSAPTTLHAIPVCSANILYRVVITPDVSCVCVCVCCMCVYLCVCMCMHVHVYVCDMY